MLSGSFEMKCGLVYYHVCNWEHVETLESMAVLNLASIGIILAPAV
jgi:uncharacterized membrane protein